MEIPFQIIFSVLVVILIVSTALYGFYIFKEKESEERVFRNFNDLVNNLNSLCWSFPGSKKEIKILINEKTIALFFTNDTENLNLEEIIERVKNSENSEGNFACLIYKNKRSICEKLVCTISYKYVGYEAKESFLDFFVKGIYGINEIEEIKIAEKVLDKKDFIVIK